MRKMLDMYGAELVSERNHIKYRLPNGKTLILPKTPSDSHSMANAVAQLRRMLK